MCVQDEPADPPREPPDTYAHAVSPESPSLPRASWLALGCANVKAPSAGSAGSGVARGHAPATPAPRRLRRRRLRRQRADRHLREPAVPARTTARAARARRRRARTAARRPSAASSTTRGQDAALQRRRLRPQRAAGGDRDRRVVRHLLVAVFGASDRRDADRCAAAASRSSTCRSATTSRWSSRSGSGGARSPSRRSRRAPTRPWRGADAPAAQQERGPHPEDRDRQRRLGRAQLPAARRSASTPASSRRESGAGRVNQYAGLNAPATNADGSAVTGTSTLWGSATSMKAYDIMLMSCEGNDNSGAGAASTAMRQAVKEFADAGGRMFGSHWHNAWVFEGPAPWPTRRQAQLGRARLRRGHHRADRDQLPEGHGVRGLDGERRRIDDAGADRHSRRRAQRRFDQPRRAAAGSPATDADKNKPMVQYFSFNTPVEARARAAVRARRDERPSRLGGYAVRFRQAAVPERLHDHRR